MREDNFTNTVEDAAAYEALRGRDADFGDDHSGEGPVPSLPEPRRLVCRARTHNPLPDGGRAPQCQHCPKCGGVVVKPIEHEEFYSCSRPSCEWTFGVRSEPPF